jgi:hypothetical protein
LNVNLLISPAIAIQNTMSNTDTSSKNTVAVDHKQQGAADEKLFKLAVTSSIEIGEGRQAITRFQLHLSSRGIYGAPGHE